MLIISESMTSVNTNSPQISLIPQALAVLCALIAEYVHSSVMAMAS